MADNKIDIRLVIIGVVAVVVLGILALWIISILLGWIWQYLWWIIGAAVVIIVAWLLINAFTGERRNS